MVQCFRISKDCGTAVQNTESGARLLGYQPLLCQLPAVWPWGNYLTSLCLTFLICNMRWIKVLPNKHFYKDCCLVAKSCPTLCHPMDCSSPGFPVLHDIPSLLRFMSIESVMSSERLKKLLFGKCLEQCLARSRHYIMLV